MNPRFQELAKRARIQMCSDARLQEYAELIVRECIDIIQGGRFLHDSAPTAQFARECTSAIRQHFEIALKPCCSPYCECEPGHCSHPGFYDDRGRGLAVGANHMAGSGGYSLGTHEEQKAFEKDRNKL